MGQDKGTTKTGTVVYIHPLRRFYVVDFEMDPDRHIRESYFFQSRGGEDGPTPKS